MSKVSYEVQKRYRRKTYVFVTMNLHNEYDKDIISFLDTVESKQGYIKALIRRDIEARKESVVK